MPDSGSKALDPRCPVFAERFVCLSAFSFVEPFHQILMPLRGALKMRQIIKRGSVVLIPGGHGQAVRPASSADVFRVEFSDTFREELLTRGWPEGALVVLERLTDASPTVLSLPQDRWDEIAHDVRKGKGHKQEEKETREYTGDKVIE